MTPLESVTPCVSSYDLVSSGRVVVVENVRVLRKLDQQFTNRLFLVSTTLTEVPSVVYDV